MKYRSNVIVKSLSYKFIEQLLTKGTSLVISIVLARLLDVESFGVLAILTVFTSLCSAIIESGLSTSLIQKKDVDDKDYSTVFYISSILAILLYAVIFLAAPWIASIYEMPMLTMYLRVIGIVLFTTPFNATQLGYVYRNMMFRQLLISTVIASLASGLLGIVLAVRGFGVWALIVQTLSNAIVSVLTLFVQIPWRPRKYFSINRLKQHWKYGWKLLVSSIVDTLYVDIQALVIGKKYSDTDLAYYNRGETYPKTIMTSLNSAVQSVMLPVLSAEQSDTSAIKGIMRKSVSISSFVLFPIMAGFAGIADSFVSIVLTDKWLPCVPFLQLACITYAVRPVNSCNLQAIKAIGRSDIFLKLTLIKKFIGIGIIFITAFCFNTPLAIAIGVAVFSPIELIINAFPNRKLVGYSLVEQVKDIALPAVFSMIMFGIVSLIGGMIGNVWMRLCIQMVVGIIVYITLSASFRVRALKDIWEKIRHILKKNVE